MKPTKQPTAADKPRTPTATDRAAIVAEWILTHVEEIGAKESRRLARIVEREAAPTSEAAPIVAAILGTAKQRGKKPYKGKTRPYSLFTSPAIGIPLWGFVRRYFGNADTPRKELALFVIAALQRGFIAPSLFSLGRNGKYYTKRKEIFNALTSELGKAPAISLFNQVIALREYLNEPLNAADLAKVNVFKAMFGGNISPALRGYFSDPQLASRNFRNEILRLNPPKVVLLTSTDTDTETDYNAKLCAALDEYIQDRLRERPPMADTYTPE